MSVDVKAQVARVMDASVPLPTGGIERKMRVDYMVGAHGPFTLILPAEQFNATAVKAEMDKMVAEIRKLQL
jgi:hypothetical protein